MFRNPLGSGPPGGRSTIRYLMALSLASMVLYLGYLYRMAAGASEESPAPAPALPLPLPLTPAGPGNFSQVTAFSSAGADDEEGGPRMFTYVPARLASARPALVVALHWCSATAVSIHNGTDWGRQYKQRADEYGFVMVYPESPHEDKAKNRCWDVSSAVALSHDSGGGGSDSKAIAEMIVYAADMFNADPERIFVMGTSSGAMMVNVLAATHPDVFTAGIVYSGVPAGCFFTDSVAGWNNECGHGEIIKPQAEWAQMALGMYPGYAGARPRLQIHHGSLDQISHPNNYNETIKQWTGVFGYNETAAQVIGNYPSAPHSRLIYGPSLEGIYANGLDHFMPVLVDADLRFFGIIP